MPPKRKQPATAKQTSITSHALPLLKKPMEAIGKQVGVLGGYWVGRMTDAEKETLYKCTVRDFTLAHKFPAQQTPVAAVSLQEMGVGGTGSTEMGDASGEIFWMPYTPDFLRCYYNTFPDELPKSNDEQKTPVSMASKEPTQDDNGAPPCLPATLPARHPGRLIAVPDR